MITLQPSIAITPIFTEQCNTKAHLKSKNDRHIHKQLPGGTLQKINILKSFSQNSWKKTSVGVSFLIKLEPEICNFIKIETETRVFFYEYCEISKHLFHRTPRVAASSRCVFQIKVTICSAFFSTLIFFSGVLKICIASKNLFTQTEKLEHILPVLPKKRNQM